MVPTHYKFRIWNLSAFVQCASKLKEAMMISFTMLGSKILCLEFDGLNFVNYSTMKTVKVFEKVEKSLIIDKESCKILPWVEHESTLLEVTFAQKLQKHSFIHSFPLIQLHISPSLKTKHFSFISANKVQNLNEKQLKRNQNLVKCNYIFEFELFDKTLFFFSLFLVPISCDLINLMQDAEKMKV